MSDDDSNVFSKFHVILSTSGIDKGSNVFSLEIHRGLSGSSSDAVVLMVLEYLELKIVVLLLILILHYRQIGCLTLPLSKSWI